MNWLVSYLNSSVGKKQLMALSGLGMVGFLIVHLSGNLLLFVGEDAFNDYAAFLEKQPWLPLARIGLIGIFVVHVALAFRLSHENKSARRTDYVYKNASTASMASRSMLLTGILVLFYLIIHLLNFTFADYHEQGLYALVVEKLTAPHYTFFYIGAMVVLGLHLVHAIQSVFQTFGINHPKFTPLIKGVSVAAAVALSLGFASIPAFLLITKGGA